MFGLIMGKLNTSFIAIVILLGSNIYTAKLAYDKNFELNFQKNVMSLQCRDSEKSVEFETKYKQKKENYVEPNINEYNSTISVDIP